MSEGEKKTARDKWRSWARYVLLAVAVGYLVYQATADNLLEKGTHAPPWSLPQAFGRGANLALTELAGKVVLLDFWSTTCPPCLREIEELKEVHRALKESGVAIVGVAAGGESLQDIELFAKDRNIDYKLVLDSSGMMSKAYQVEVLPTVYIIDRQGKIAAAHSGYQGREKLLREVRRVL